MTSSPNPARRTPPRRGILGRRRPDAPRSPDGVLSLHEPRTLMAGEMTLFQAERLGQSVNTRYVFIGVSVLLSIAGYTSGALAVAWPVFLGLQALTFVVNGLLDLARRRGMVRDWHFWMMLAFDTLVIGGNAVAFGQLGYFALLYYAIAAVGHSLGLPRAARVQLIAACVIYPASRIAGLTLADVAPSLQSVGLVLTETICLGGLGWLGITGPIRFTYRLRRARRALGYLEHGAFDTRLPVGTVDELGFLAVSFNRTAEALAKAEAALKEREAELRQSQKLEAVGRLAGGVAHDFNNLLSVIVGNLDLASAEVAAGSPVHADIQEAMLAARRAGELTQQLLAFGRKQILNPTMLDVCATVRENVPMLSRLVGSHIHMVTELAATPCVARADASQLSQVVLNLAANARDAMGAVGGTLTLRVDCEDVAAARLRGAVLAGQLDANAPDGWIVVSVRDTGEGMREETIAKIFEPFFTTKPSGKGTGLGLSTVHGIVTQSGGIIAVESTLGVGTVFSVYLPRRRDAVATPGAPALSPPLAPPATGEPVAEHADLPFDAPRPWTSSPLVLLVEDEAAVRLAMRRILERDGITVIEAADGLEALERFLIRQQLAETDPSAAIDLVVTDLMMPRLGGAELAARLRARQPSLPVILMSGYSEISVEQEFEALPGALFIKKPPQPNELQSAVRALLPE